VRYLTLPIVLVAILMISSSRASHGQVPQVLGPDRNPLAKVKGLTCTFSVSSTGSWKGGEPKGEIKAETIAVELDSIDTEEGTARLPGADPTFMTALLAANSLHFMERSLQGNLTVITVFSEPDPKGRYRAVRSRHNYLKMAIPGFVAEPTVSQQYGECEAGH
jgi:hypothetical protein